MPLCSVTPWGRALPGPVESGAESRSFYHVLHDCSNKEKKNKKNTQRSGVGETQNLCPWTSSVKFLPRVRTTGRARPSRAGHTLVSSGAAFSGWAACRDRQGELLRNSGAGASLCTRQVRICRGRSPGIRVLKHPGDSSEQPAFSTQVYSDE